MSSQHQEGCQTLSRQQPQQQTGGEIGAEGAGTLSEALKANTTLTTLRLYGVQQQDNNTDTASTSLAKQATSPVQKHQEH